MLGAEYDKSVPVVEGEKTERDTHSGYSGDKQINTADSDPGVRCFVFEADPPASDAHSHPFEVPQSPQPLQQQQQQQQYGQRQRPPRPRQPPVSFRLDEITEALTATEATTWEASASAAAASLVTLGVVRSEVTMGWGAQAAAAEMAAQTADEGAEALMGAGTGVAGAGAAASLRALMAVAEAAPHPGAAAAGGAANGGRRTSTVHGDLLRSSVSALRSSYTVAQVGGGGRERCGADQLEVLRWPTMAQVERHLGRGGERREKVWVESGVEAGGRRDPQSAVTPGCNSCQ